MGQVFTIIANDGADPVSGTFAGLPEGGAIVVNGVRLQISYVGGSGNDVTLTRVKFPTTATISASPNTVPVGGTITFTATVRSAPGGPTPTGEVTFKEGPLELGKAALDSSGVATLQTEAGIPGEHRVIAAYPGDANTDGADSAPVFVDVTSVPPPPPGLGGLAITPKSFGPGGSSSITFFLSRPATVTFIVEQLKEGIMRGGRCKVGGKRPKGATRCTRYDYFGRFTADGQTAHNRVTFAGTASGRQLPAGRYRITAIPANAGGTGTPSSVRLRIT
jgi:hypothetical protein